jgi:large subunit ribosomal protein L2
MPIKFYKPTTPARRKTSVVDTSDLTKKSREKSLCEALNKKSGRNNSGRLVVRHQAGGAKKIYRKVDFKRLRFDVKAEVLAIEYDPNRNARITLIEYADDKSKSYILAANKIKIGDKVLSSDKKIEAKTGNRMPLEFIPQGETVYNIELEYGKGGKIGRSAGSAIVLQNAEGKFAQLKMPSGEIRLIRKNCLATLGQVSNPEAKLVRIGKAGRKRHMGIKPTVRGKAMNPCDHPHGGGEGSQPIGIKAGPKNVYGKLAMGVKTRRKNNWTNKLIIKGRKKR